jgi:hypothetical protein
MRKRRRTWFLKRLALGLTAAVIAAPAAQAYPDQGAQSGLRAEGTVCVPKWGCRTTGPIRPDDRAVRGVQSTDVQPQVATRSWPGVNPTSLEAQNHGATQVASVPRAAAPVGGANTVSDTDWGDVGIGAGLAFALMLLAAGAAVGTRHRHKSATI